MELSYSQPHPLKVKLNFTLDDSQNNTYTTLRFLTHLDQLFYLQLRRSEAHYHGALQGASSPTKTQPANRMHGEESARYPDTTPPGHITHHKSPYSMISSHRKGSRLRVSQCYRSMQRAATDQARIEVHQQPNAGLPPPRQFTDYEDIVYRSITSFTSLLFRRDK